MARNEVPNPQQIMIDMMAAGNELAAKNVELIQLAEKKARAEANYRVFLAEKMLELRADGSSATLTPDLARGDKRIAKLKMDRDIADAVYEACRDRIRDLRTQIEVLRSILTWQRAELNGGA